MEEVEGGVKVWGARGKLPTPHYKISATYLDGYKVGYVIRCKHRERIRHGDKKNRSLLLVST